MAGLAASGNQLCLSALAASLREETPITQTRRARRCKPLSGQWGTQPRPWYTAPVPCSRHCPQQHSWLCGTRTPRGAQTRAEGPQQPTPAAFHLCAHTMGRAAPRTPCTIIFPFALYLYSIQFSQWQWAHCGKRESSAQLSKPTQPGAGVLQSCQEFALLPGPSAPSVPDTGPNPSPLPG